LQGGRGCLAKATLPCFIPIQQDAGGGVELELVALLEGAPAVIVGLRVEGDLFLGGFNKVVEKNKVGRFVKLPRADAVLGQGKLDPADLQAGLLEDFPFQRLLGGFARLDLAARPKGRTISGCGA
jgi:hypothetical protein